MVTDENVDAYQAQACIEGLQSAGYHVEKYVIKPGEASKNLDTIREIYNILLKLKLDRSSALIALGGGVVGDITGFAAATFLRGINFIQVPTSLLAQADSSVGGKVGVDFEGSKNIIGAFYQPKLVYINVNSLKTLPEREMRAGLAEIIKHGIIMDEEFFEYVEYNIPKILNLDEEVLQYVTKVNCTIKGGVVQQDEKESGLRALLNFGHTYGHAIESVSNFNLLHGECVSIGMMGALKLARLMEMVDEAVVVKVEKALKKAGLPVKAAGLDLESVYSQLFHDKKMKDEKLVFVLPKAIGDLYSLAVEDEEMIRAALAEILE
jgi:3-dehydroquinate synthase